MGKLLSSPSLYEVGLHRPRGVDLGVLLLIPQRRSRLRHGAGDGRQCSTRR